MNRAFIVGRLVRDPEVRTTPNGKMVTSFTVAVNRFGAPGQKESTDFIPVVTWEKLAENCGNGMRCVVMALAVIRPMLQSQAGALSPPLA